MPSKDVDVDVIVIDSSEEEEPSRAASSSKLKPKPPVKRKSTAIESSDDSSDQSTPTAKKSAPKKVAAAKVGSKVIKTKSPAKPPAKRVKKAQATGEADEKPEAWAAELNADGAVDLLCVEYSCSKSIVELISLLSGKHRRDRRTEWTRELFGRFNIRIYGRDDDTQSRSRFRSSQTIWRVRFHLPPSRLFRQQSDPSTDILVESPLHLLGKRVTSSLEPTQESRN